MNISREDQKQFARELLAIADNTSDVEVLMHLKKLASLLVSWVGEENGVTVLLGECMYEIVSVARGGEDDGWKDEFRKMLDAELTSADPGGSNYGEPMGGCGSVGNELTVSFGSGSAEGHTLLGDGDRSEMNFLDADSHNYYGSGNQP